MLYIDVRSTPYIIVMVASIASSRYDVLCRGDDASHNNSSIILFVRVQQYMMV